MNVFNGLNLLAFPDNGPDIRSKLPISNALLPGSLERCIMRFMAGIFLHGQQGKSNQSPIIRLVVAWCGFDITRIVRWSVEVAACIDLSGVLCMCIVWECRAYTWLCVCVWLTWTKSLKFFKCLQIIFWVSGYIFIIDVKLCLGCLQVYSYTHTHAHTMPHLWATCTV